MELALHIRSWFIAVDKNVKSHNGPWLGNTYGIWLNVINYLVATVCVLAIIAGQRVVIQTRAYIWTWYELN